MCLDKLAADVSRRACPTLRRVVERVYDAQGMWVCALERAELLAQEYVCFGNVRVEQRKMRQVRGIRERMVE